MGQRGLCPLSGFPRALESEKDPAQWDKVGWRPTGLARGMTTLSIAPRGPKTQQWEEEKGGAPGLVCS